MKIKLYKYMPAQYALGVLRDREIKVSTAFDVNDPNEMIPNYVDAAYRPMINSAETRDMFRKCNLENTLLFPCRRNGTTMSCGGCMATSSQEWFLCSTLIWRLMLTMSFRSVILHHEWF